MTLTKIYPVSARFQNIPDGLDVFNNIVCCVDEENSCNAIPAFYPKKQ